MLRPLQVVWSLALSMHNSIPVALFYLTTASLYGLGVLWTLFVIVNALGCWLWWLAGEGRGTLAAFFCHPRQWPASVSILWRGKGHKQ